VFQQLNRWWQAFIIVLLVLILATIPFWVWDIDMTVQQIFFDPDRGGWYLQEHPFWKSIYQYGIFPGLVMSLMALFTVAASYWRVQWQRLRKPALLLVFALMLGPGLIINLVFKDYYGRPRPRQVEAFGGTDTYTPVWVYSTSGGKSFPCGHGAIGFYMAIPFLFLRNTRKKLAWSFLILGTAYGLLLSFARVAAGGHFTSDVLWAAGMVWLAAIAVSKWIRLDEPSKAPSSKKQARRMSWLIGGILPVITVGLLLATPYVSAKKYTLTNEQLTPFKTSGVELIFDEALLDIREGSAFEVEYQANGFGFPNSKVRPQWSAETGKFYLKKTGWFTEMHIDATITLPPDYPFKISLGSGEIKNEYLPDHVQIFHSEATKKPDY